MTVSEARTVVLGYRPELAADWIRSKNRIKAGECVTPVVPTTR